MPKAPVKPYKATVEDSNGSDHALESEVGKCDMATRSDSCRPENFPLDENPEPEGSGFDEVDIIDDANSFTFSNVLQMAQEVALEAERKKDESKKRPKHYTRNSKEVFTAFMQI